MESRVNCWLLKLALHLLFLTVIATAVTPAPLPDLAIGQVNIPAPFPASGGTITVEVVNRGGAAPATMLLYYINWEGTTTTEVSDVKNVPALAAGASTSIPIQIGRLLGGTRSYTLSLQADARHFVVESNEGNNAKDVTFQAVAGAPTSTPTPDPFGNVKSCRIIPDETRLVKGASTTFNLLCYSDAARTQLTACPQANWLLAETRLGSISPNPSAPGSSPRVTYQSSATAPAGIYWNSLSASLWIGSSIYACAATKIELLNPTSTPTPSPSPTPQPKCSGDSASKAFSDYQVHEDVLFETAHSYQPNTDCTSTVYSCPAGVKVKARLNASMQAGDYAFVQDSAGNNLETYTGTINSGAPFWTGAFNTNAVKMRFTSNAAGQAYGVKLSAVQCVKPTPTPPPVPTAMPTRSLQLSCPTQSVAEKTAVATYYTADGVRQCPTANPSLTVTHASGTPAYSTLACDPASGKQEHTITTDKEGEYAVQATLSGVPQSNPCSFTVKLDKRQPNAVPDSNTVIALLAALAAAAIVTRRKNNE